MKSELKKKMETVLADAIDRQETSGANVLVMKDGEELCYLEAGLADRKAGKAIQRDTIFRLYSMTKPVTAVAAMILLERGQLSLQTPVEKYLPAFAKGKTAGKSTHLCSAEVTADRAARESLMEDVQRPVTIQDLLNMTSGLTYGDSDTVTETRTRQLLLEAEKRLSWGVPMTTQQFAKEAGGIPLLFQPGTSWSYGISADVMGAVIEKVTGQTFGDFLKSEIFHPLGMRDTDFYVPEEKQGRLAKAYETGDDGTLSVYTSSFLGIRNSMKEKAQFESGGAGLVSTIGDYERFARMLLGKGRLGQAEILQPATVDNLTGGRLSKGPQEGFERWFGQRGYSYGNFMRVLWNPELADIPGKQMEYCWDGWLGCCFLNCPREGVTFLVMQQKKDAGQLVARLKNIVFSHQL